MTMALVVRLRLSGRETYRLESDQTDAENYERMKTILFEHSWNQSYVEEVDA